MPSVKRTSLLLFFLAGLVCLGCDQITKDLARDLLANAPPSFHAFGTVELAYAENPGAFLSMGAALPEWVRKLVFVFAVPLVLLVLCVTFLRQESTSRIEASALGLVVGGGIGNWLDRILHDGAVTDFMRLGVGPLHTGIFNVADVAIMGGLGALIFGMWRAPRADPVDAPPAPES